MTKGNERYHNLTALFRTLRSERFMTQVDLKDRLSLQASTISYLVNDLRLLGLVKNSDKSILPKRVGKPGQLIELDNNHALFLGLYIEETFVDFHVMGIADEEISSERIPIDCTPEQLSDLIISLIAQRIARYPAVKGIGIAVKSVVDSHHNLSSFKRHYNESQKNRIWMVEGFAEKIRIAFPSMSVVVENDANCAAVYCQSVSKYRYNTSMVFVINVAPFGIGCGIIIEGKLFRGSNGASGEFFFPDRSIQEMVETNQFDHSPERLIPILKESITKGIYLIDPEIAFLTGSLFSDFSEDSVKQTQAYLRDIPYRIEILSEHQYSLPAKGVVLLVADEYASHLFLEKNRRQP